MMNLPRLVLNRLEEILFFGGIRKNKISQRDFFLNIRASDEVRPVFFLSTGRVGTLFFSKLIEMDKNFKVYHSPEPELIREGKVAYELFSQYGFENGLLNKALSSLVSASREKMLYKAYVYGKTYVETNNRISFLAPVLKNYFPHAKFVHLYRHPGEFIRSGIRRDWYSGTQNHDTGRLEPLQGSSFYGRWEEASKIEKIAWLWNETNKFIGEYLETLPGDDYFTFNFNNLNLENVMSLLDFIGANSLSEAKIYERLSKPENIQKGGLFPAYSEWDNVDKSVVRNICGDLASQYDYDL